MKLVQTPIYNARVASVNDFFSMAFKRMFVIGRILSRKTAA